MQNDSMDHALLLLLDLAKKCWRGFKKVPTASRPARKKTALDTIMHVIQSRHEHLSLASRQTCTILYSDDEMAGFFFGSIQKME